MMIDFFTMIYMLKSIFFSPIESDLNFLKEASLLIIVRKLLMDYSSGRLMTYSSVGHRVMFSKSCSKWLSIIPRSYVV